MNCGSCEHPISEHTPRCEQQCIDGWGDVYTCPCPKFEKDTDD